MKTILILGVAAIALMLGASVQAIDTAPPAGGYCGFTVPATYYGELHTIGFETQTESAFIARTEQFAWQGEIIPRGYVVDVYQRTNMITPPCFTGGVVTFSLEGHPCHPWVLWSSGAHGVDLLCVAT